MLFENQVAVITGAAGGLGKAIAKALYEQGCHLALIDIDLNNLTNTSKEFHSKHQQVSTHHANISVESEVMQVRQDIVAVHGKINILINNAGISISQYFEHMKLADYHKVFDTNFWGTVYCTKHFLDDLKKENNSRLVNIISGFALLGFPGKSAYGSSKSALMGFTYALRTELSPHIKVSLVIPPPIDTGLVRNGHHIDENKKQNEILFLNKQGMPVDKVANAIIKNVHQGRFRILVGVKTYWLDLSSRMFPTLAHKMVIKNKSRFDFL